MQNFPPKGFYYHYKHDPEGEFNNYSYEVIGIARHSETKESMVMYRPLYKNQFLGNARCVVRPLNMFMGEVERDVKTVKRFSLIEDVVLIGNLQKIREEMYGI